LVPAAMTVLLLGMAASALIYYSTQPFKASSAVLSDYENREDNPQGYGFAATGTALGCALLFPAALLFRGALRGAWSGVGAWIYGAGSVSGIVMAALEPFLSIFHPVHILLAFMTFIGLSGGLGCVSVAAARARLRPGRGVWSAAATVFLIAILLILEVIPLPKRGPAGFFDSLAAGELALILLIGAGTGALARCCEPRRSETASVN
jgi:hypothetical protein